MTGMGLTYIHAGLRACSWAVRQMTSYDIVEVSLSGPSLGSWLQKIDCLHNGKKSGTSCGSLSAWLPRLPRITRKGQQKHQKESSSKLHGGEPGVALCAQRFQWVLERQQVDGNIWKGKMGKKKVQTEDVRETAGLSALCGVQTA